MRDRTYYILWLLIGMVSLCNMHLDVMDVDAAQYASMAVEMHETGNYLQVFHRGADYLDKPPLLFWLSALSFKVFGVSNFAYKLPAVLVLILGLWSLFRLTCLKYSREAGMIAVTIMASTQAFFLMTNDVRTDGLLTAFVIFAVYNCAAWLDRGGQIHLLMAGLGVGLAMLAKGPIGVAIPVIVLAADRLLKGRWKDLFKWEWLLVALIALLVLTPMLYGLYMQFDLHPEKTVYGLEGPSGMKFFFWTQSFGRITGDIYWDNNTPFTFFMTTFLWDFMPWVIIFIVGSVFIIRRIRKQGKDYPEFMSTIGFLIVFLLLSLSRYKLPHYIFPLFPFAAMLAASYLARDQFKRGKLVAAVQFGFVHLFFIIAVFAYVQAFPPHNALIPLITVTGFIAMWIAFLRTQSHGGRIVLITTIAAIAFNAFMALHFYPNLLKYQSGAQAGRMIHADRQDNERPYYAFPGPTYSLDFYAGEYIHTITATAVDDIPAGSWIYTTADGLDELYSSASTSFDTVHTFDHYHVTMLKWGFVMRETREEHLQERYIVEKK